MALSMCACGGETETSAPTTEPAATEPTKPAPTVAVVEGQPIAQLDDVSVYIGVSGKAKEVEGLPAYTYSGDKTNYKFKETRYEKGAHIFSDTDAAAFINYLNALEADGWVQYSNNIMEGTNLFATYTKGSGSLYCYYISARQRTYIITSPDQNLEIREQDNIYTAICTPLLTQVKLYCQAYQGGMSYLLRLSDGRFIIIDGGYNENNYYEAEALYALMQEQNVLDKPTVAAWILTHPHSDHLGAASDFLRHYTEKDVAIQQFIYNFPTEKDGSIDEDLTDTNNVACLPTFLLALEMRWPDVPITVCHTGQEYYFADAKLEFLHTLEDYYPKSLDSLSSNQINGASAIFTVEIGGQRTMFLGGCALDQSASLVEMWTDALKCDIMQAAHHCQRGGTVALYEAIDPTVVLAPLPAENITARNILSYEATRWLWNNESGKITEIILSGFKQRTLELPYTSPEGTAYFPDATTDPWGGKANQYQTKK